MELKAPVSYVLFDVDNTLYPASSPMLKRINVLINRYIMDMFSLSWQQAQTLRRQAYHTYGTTLRWLQVEHGFTDTEGYLQSIHPPDTDYWLKEDDTLAPALQDLPVGRSILTNSIREHAQRILDFLGISDQFEQIYDIRYNELISKPDRRAYTKVLDAVGVPAEEIVFVDDNPAFLETFRSLGGQGVLMDHLNVHGNTSFLRVRSVTELVLEIKKCCPYTVYKDS